MNRYKISFAPELDISITDFVVSWNNIQHCREIAKAQIETTSQGDYDIGSLGIIAVLTYIGTVATTALNELVKQAIAEYFKNRQKVNNLPAPTTESIEVREIEQADGSKLIIVVLKQ